MGVCTGVPTCTGTCKSVPTGTPTQCSKDRVGGWL